MLTYQKVRTAIENTKQKLERLDPKQKLELDNTLKTLSVAEFGAYQNLKSVAFAEDKIDLDTANYLYRSLGEWNTLPLEDRIIITQLCGQFASVV
jgi:hypothetical protein